MDTMFTFQLHTRTNSLGLFIVEKTLTATYNMLGARQMSVKGGPAPKKRAWTVTALERGIMSILRTVVQVVVVAVI